MLPLSVVYLFLNKYTNGYNNLKLLLVHSQVTSASPGVVSMDLTFPPQTAGTKHWCLLGAGCAAVLHQHRGCGAQGSPLTWSYLQTAPGSGARHSPPTEEGERKQVP